MGTVLTFYYTYAVITKRPQKYDGLNIIEAYFFSHTTVQE